MTISNKTLYSQALAEALTEESKQRIKERAVDYFLGVSLWEMKLGLFLSFLSGDFSKTNVQSDCEKYGGLTFFAKMFIERIGDFVTEFGKSYGDLSPKQSPAEKQASEVCLPVTFAESLLFYTRSFFGLKSFSECENITMAEILLARKETYNDVMFKKRFSEIEMQKIKSKRK